MFFKPLDIIKAIFGLGGASEPAPAIPAFCPGTRGSLKFDDPRLEANYLRLMVASVNKYPELESQDQLSRHVTENLSKVAEDIDRLRNSGPSAGSNDSSLTARSTHRENRHLIRYREDMTCRYRDVIHLKREFYKVFDPAYTMYVSHDLRELTELPGYPELVAASVLAYRRLNMIAPAEAHLHEMEIEFLLEMM